MGEQIQWLFQATVAQFWLPARLGTRDTTLFVRRMILWSVVGLPAAWVVAANHRAASVVPIVLFALLAWPMSTALLLLVGTAAMFAFRVFAVMAGSLSGFHGALGWPGAVLLAASDVLWWVEAGATMGREQWNASRQGLHRAN